MYSKFSGEQLILRDLLAKDRTILANERTLLSYLRTSLGFGAAGATVIQFATSSPFTQAVGWLLCLFAAMVGGFGIYRFTTVARRLASIAEQVAEPVDQAHLDEHA